MRLVTSAALALTAALACSFQPSASATSAPRSIVADPVFPRRVIGPGAYDVIVVGGGTSGIAAALQAARMGARVALLEETDWIGGQMTAAAVSTMDEGAAAIRQAGLYREFIDRVRSHYAASGKSIGTCYWSSASACFEPLVGQRMLKQMVEATNAKGPGRAEVFIRTTVTGVVRGGAAVRGVVVGGKVPVRGKVVIDATEYGDLLALAGVPYRVGNTRSDALNPDACVQSITYAAVIKKYPGGVPSSLKIAAAPSGYAEARPEFAAVVAPGGSTTPSRLPVSFSYHNAYRGVPDSAAPGSYRSIDHALITKTGVNWANDHPATVRFVEDRTYRKQLACRAKLKTIQFLYHVQSTLGADWSVADDQQYDTAYNREENSCPDIPPSLKEIEWRLPQVPYVREARRAVGVQTLAARDIKRSGAPSVADKTFETGVAVGAYPMDLHACNAAGDLEADLESIGDLQGYSVSGFFQIPAEVLVPGALDGLVLAEKNISQSRLVNGATRLQPSTMLVGQAAGATAALAVSGGQEPRAVSPVAVQRAVIADGSFVSKHQFPDVPATHPRWADVQLATAHGLLTEPGMSTFGPNNTVTRAQAAVLMARLFKTPSPPVETPVSVSVSRAQFAALLARGLGYRPTFVPSGQHFSDVPSTHGVYPFVEYLATRGVRVPCAVGVDVFCPEIPLQRGDAARFAAQAITSIAGQGRR